MAGSCARFLNRPDPEPFSAEEVSKTADAPGIDGLLVDYAAKGSKIELEGTETVEDKATYRLEADQQARPFEPYLDRWHHVPRGQDRGPSAPV